MKKLTYLLPALLLFINCKDDTEKPDGGQFNYGGKSHPLGFGYYLKDKEDVVGSDTFYSWYFILSSENVQLKPVFTGNVIQVALKVKNNDSPALPTGTFTVPKTGDGNTIYETILYVDYNFETKIGTKYQTFKSLEVIINNEAGKYTINFKIVLVTDEIVKGTFRGYLDPIS